MSQFNIKQHRAAIAAGTLSVEAAGDGALHCADVYGETVAYMRGKLKGKSADVIRATLLPIVAAHYAVPVVDGERKAKGTKVLDKTAEKYNTAKSALQRLSADIVGVTSGKGEELEVPEHIAALAAKLAKACNEYEQAKRLAATAIAAAFAA